MPNLLIFLGILLFTTSILAQTFTLQPFGDDRSTFETTFVISPLELEVSPTLKYYPTVEPISANVIGILIVSKDQLDNSAKISAIETIYSQTYFGFTLLNSTASSMGSLWDIDLTGCILKTTEIEKFQTQTVTYSGESGTLYCLSRVHRGLHFMMTFYTPTQLCERSIYHACRIIALIT